MSARVSDQAESGPTVRIFPILNYWPFTGRFQVSAASRCPARSILPMRILYLSQLVPYPADAGPKVRSFHVLEYLAQAGHQVTLLAFTRPDDQPEAIAHLRRFCLAVHTVPMPRSRSRDIWHLGQSLLGRRPFLIARDRVSAMHEAVATLMADADYDVIHADQLWMAQYALAAAGNSDHLRRVLDQHNAVYLIPQRLAESTRNPLARWLLARESRLLRRYETATCAAFDHVVWVTEEDRLAVANGAASSGREAGWPTIPNCVDPPRQKPITGRTEGRRVSFLGGLHWPPNAAGVGWFARQVWPQVIAAVPDATLTVMGKRPPAELRALSRELPNVEVTGYVAEVAPYLAQTAAFIVPLHAAGGMRVKIVDAWSWGLPVVTTTIGAEGLDYRDGQNLVLADDPGAFARAVIRLLQEPDWRAQLAAAGRRTAETRYDWRRIYPAWDAIYGAPA